jgi:hypothetical protein
VSSLGRLFSLARTTPSRCARDAPASCLAAVLPVPLHGAVLLRSRTGRCFRASALATVLLAHVLALAGMRLTLGFAESSPAIELR